MQRSYIDAPRPIVALATGPFEAALALVRAAGPGCIELAAGVFSRPDALREARGHSLVHGELVDPATGEAIDEVLVAVFRAPASFTGEDQIEVSCHGSTAVTRRILALFEAAGFCPALPGEFSFRAFANGKTDLVRAEAIDEIVRSRSDSARADALARLEGGLSRRLSAARASLLGLMAEIELRLDYGEDEVEGLSSNLGGEPPGDMAPALARLARLGEELGGLAASYSAGRRVAQGLAVVLAGPPNAGKSRLFNLFLREERSIVSPEAGTTRDWIEAEMEIEGLRLRLIDTAGLRDATGSIEAEGVARSARMIAEADILLYLVDASAGPPTPADEAFMAAHPGALPVLNKIDLAPAPGPAPSQAGFSTWTLGKKALIAVSAATGEGFGALVAALGRVARDLVAAGVSPGGVSPGGVSPGGVSPGGVSPGGVSPGGVSPGGATGGSYGGGERIASERQHGLLCRAQAAIDTARADLETGLGLDMTAVDLREAADALGEITGEIAAPEVLEALFSRFCVGK
jgi:tRNA modification GTPase